MGSQLYILEEPQQYLEENRPINPDPVLDFAQSHVSALAIDENGKMRWETYYLFNVPKRESHGCKAAYLVSYSGR
jgi:hypothetical protein